MGPALEKVEDVSERIVIGFKTERVKTILEIPQVKWNCDVKYFILWIGEMTEESRRRDTGALLHLLAQYCGHLLAQYCGRTTAVKDVFQTLKARYGTSSKEGRRQ